MLESYSESVIVWSKIDNASLAEPAAALPIIDSILFSILTFSLSHTLVRSLIMFSSSSCFKSNLWQRDNIVKGIFCTSVVAKINFT